MEKSLKIPTHIRLVLAGCFLNCFFSFAFPMMSLIISAGNKSALEYLPWMMSAAYLISALLQPSIGSLLDQGSTRKVVTVATLLACTGMFCLYAFGNYLSLVVISLGIIVMGLSVISSTGSMIVEGQVSPELRGKTSLLFSGLGNLGFGFSALLAYWFLDQHKGMLLLLDGISTLVYGFILIKSDLVNPGGLVAKPLREEPKRNDSLPLDSEQYSVLAGVLLLFIAIVSSFSIVPLQYQILGRDYVHFTPVMFGVNNVVVFLTSMLFLNRVGRMSVPFLSIISALFLGIGLSLVPLVQNQFQNILVTTIWSIGEVIAYPVIAKSVFESFRKGNEGRAAGYKTAMLRLAFVLGPAFVGILQKGETWGFSLTFGMIPILGSLLLWKMFKHEKAVLQEVQA